MPGNWCGPGRAGGHSGTTAGTAPRPEGCSRARRRRTGAGMTGSGGRAFCASQRCAASTRATPLPPLGMSLSVMSGVSDRMSAEAGPGVRRGRGRPAQTERTRVPADPKTQASPCVTGQGFAGFDARSSRRVTRPAGAVGPVQCAFRRSTAVGASTSGTARPARVQGRSRTVSGNSRACHAEPTRRGRW
jgi:hypothetical protein